MATLTAPSGRNYTWNKPGDPTKQDMDALVAYDSSVTKPAMGDLKLAEEELLDAASDQRKIDVATASARAGGGGFIASPSVDVGRSTAKGVVNALPLAAGLVAGSAVAVPVGAGILATGGALALSGALGGAAAQTTEEILHSKEGALGRIAWETGKGAVLGTALSPIVRYGPKAYTSARELFTSGTASRMDRAKAALFKPRVPHPGALEADAARDVVESTTGIRVPMGVGEAIGNPKISSELTDLAASAEISQEAMDAIKRGVVFTATRLRNAMSTSDDLAKETIAALQTGIGRISKPAEDAVKALSNELHPAIKKGFDEVLNEATTLIPGTAATPTSLGDRIKTSVKAAYDEFKGIDNANYVELRKLPEYSTVTVGSGNISKWASKLDSATVQAIKKEAPEEFSLLVDEFGRGIPSGASAAETTGGAIPSLLPEGTRTTVQAVGKMEGQQTLEAMRNFRTTIGDSIGDVSVLPGVSDKAKIDAYSALTKDITQAVEALPTGELKQSLQKANAFHAGNVERFVGRTTGSILKEAGAGGGAAPAGVADKLLGGDAPTFLNTLRETAGATHAGDVTTAAREFLFNYVGKSSRNAVTGELSVDSVVTKISGLAPEIQAEFFPGLSALQKIAKREAALKKLKTDSVLTTLEVDTDLLQQALQGDAKGVSDRLSAAVKASMKAQQTFKGTVLNALRDGKATELAEEVARDPARFVRSILDGGSFSPDQTRKAMDVIFRESPTVGAQLQFQMVDDVLSTYTSAKGINAQRLAHDLKPESATGKSGLLREHLESVLGTGTFSHMEAMVKSLATMDKTGTTISAQSPLLEVAAKGVGGLLGGVAGSSINAGTFGSANAAGWLYRLGPKLRYWVASSMLTSQELRQIAKTPISRITQENIRDITAATVRSISAVEGSDATDAHELVDLSR